MRAARALTFLAVSLLFAGCANPAVDGPATVARSVPASPGEPAAPAPPPPSGEQPADVQRTPGAAIERFAVLYMNWDSQTLRARQRTLAGVAVGPARLWARQLAVSGRLQTLARSQVWNRGRVIALAPERDRAGWWVLVTRERTGGKGEYAGLPAQDHLTLARTVMVPDGWAVSEWFPQS